MKRLTLNFSLLSFFIMLFVSGCGMMNVVKESSSDPIKEAKILIEKALDERQAGNKKHFAIVYKMAAEKMKQSNAPSEMLRDENMPDTLASLLSSPPLYRNHYKGDDLRQFLREAEDLNDERIKSIKKTTTWNRARTQENIVDKKWPFSRNEIKNELTNMLDDWGEPAFAVDEELVRHVCYFYKYYSIKDFKRSNSAIERSKKILPYIISVFKRYRLPEEIAFALPFVESSFHPNAKSNVGATGMFQFMKSTARIYGLKVTRGTDERKDYKKAATACAKYLRNNRNVFASTVLALGSYHHGTGKVSQVLLTAANADERNFGSIFKNKRLGKYSKEYIPQCLAAALIYRFMKERQLAFLPEMITENQTIKRSVSLGSLEKTVADIFELNPDLENVKTTYSYASTAGYVLLSKLSIGKVILASSVLTDNQKLVKAPESKTAKIIIEEINIAATPVYRWPENPAIEPSGNLKVAGRPKFIRYVFQEGNRLEELANIFSTTVAKLKKSHENLYLNRRKPRPGDVIRIDGLSPTTQKLGGGGYLCGKKAVLKTRNGETLNNACKRAIKAIRTSCSNSKWRLGTDVTPHLIYYWNREILGNIGPNETLEGGLPLTIYSDYLWQKAVVPKGEKKKTLIASDDNASKNYSTQRKSASIYITYIIQDDNVRQGHLIDKISDIFHLSKYELLKWNPWLKAYNSTQENGKKTKLIIKNCPDTTQKFGNPGVVCNKGGDTRFYMKKGESLKDVVWKAKAQIQSSACEGMGKGITCENILYWNADALSNVGVSRIDDLANKPLKLTIYADFY